MLHYVNTFTIYSFTDSVKGFLDWQMWKWTDMQADVLFHKMQLKLCSKNIYIHIYFLYRNIVKKNLYIYQ